MGRAEAARVAGGIQGIVLGLSLEGLAYLFLDSMEKGWHMGLTMSDLEWVLSTFMLP